MERRYDVNSFLNRPQRVAYTLIKREKEITLHDGIRRKTYNVLMRFGLVTCEQIGGNQFRFKLVADPPPYRPGKQEGWSVPDRQKQKVARPPAVYDNKPREYYVDYYLKLKV